MRTLAYVNFKTRTARESIKLKQRSGAVFRWEEIRPCVQLGYRKRRANAGDWWLRVYEHGKYRTERLALADDGDLVADGDRVLTYDQARESVLKRSGDGAVTISKGTVADARRALHRRHEDQGQAERARRRATCEPAHHPAAWLDRCLETSHGRYPRMAERAG